MALNFLNNAYFAAKVGIGTETPDGDLEVIASTVVSGASDSVNNVLIGLQSANRPTIILDTADTTYTNRTWNITNVGSAGKLFIGRNGLDVMVMDNAGNIGIGTPSPDTRLHIDQPANDRTGGLFLERNTSNYGLSLFVNSGGYGIIGSGGSIAVDILSLDLGTGDVGIGTSSFNNFTGARELLVQGSSAASNAVVQVISNDGNSSLGMYSGASSTDDPLLVYQNDLRFGSTTNDGLQSYAERMRITSAGRVGIGVTSPLAFDTTTTKFHVKNEGSSGSLSEVARFEGSSDASGSGGTIRLTTSNDRGMYFEGGRTATVPYGKIGVTEYDGAKTLIMTLQHDKLTIFEGLVSGITPVNAANFVTKAYVDGSGGGTGPFLPLAGGTLTGNLTGTTATFTGNAAINGTIIGSDQTFGNPYRTFAFGSNANGSNRIFATTDATDGIYINAATGKGINFRVNGGGSNVMVIDSSGNVGIGTTTPDAKLHIYGSSSLSEMYLGEDAATDKAGILKYAQGDGSGTGVITLSHYGNNSASESLAIKYGGNVGIGTTSPSKKLVVAQSNVTEPSGIDTNTSILIKNNTWSGIQMISTEATGNFITFGDNAAGFAGRIQYSHATNAMQFETAASEKMRITSAGDILIKGTLSPYTTANRGNITLNGTAGNIIAFTNNSGAKGYIYHDNASLDIVNEVSGNLRLKTAGTTRVDINSSGSIAFNAYDSTNKTGTPTYILGTDASGNVVKVLGADIPGAGGTGTVTGTGVAGQVAYWTTSTNIANNAGMSFANDQMQLDGLGGADGFNLPYDQNPGYSNMSAGGFGILFREARDNYILGNAYFYRTGNANTFRAKYGTDGATQIASDTGGFDFLTAPANTTAPHTLTFSSRMIIKQGGNVGIGTTSPGSKLEVNENSNSTVYSKVFNQNAGVSATARMAVVAQSAQLDFIATSAGYTGVSGWADSGIISTDSGASGGLILNAQTGGLKLQTGLSTKMVILAGGNVGIGRTNTAAKLDIKGSGGLTGLTFRTTDASDNEIFFIQDGGRTGVRYYPLTIGQASGTSAASGARFQVATTVSGGDFVVMNDGKTGIGTQDPGAQLEIATQGTAKGLKIFQERTETATDIASIIGFYTLGLAKLRGGVDSGLYISNVTDNIVGIQGATLAGAANNLSLQPFGGNIGIGTTSPAFPLSVESASTSYVFSETTGAATSSGYRWKTTSSEFAWFSTSGTNALNLYDYVANATRMVISSAGALRLNAYGAGTLVTDASGNITVSSGGGAGGPYLPLTGGTLTSTTSPILILNPTANNYGGAQFNYGGAVKGIAMYNSGFMVFGGESGVWTRLQAGGQYGLHLDATNRNVHIGGTTDATSKLQVTGDGILATGGGDVTITSKPTTTTGRAFFKNVGDTGSVLVSAVYGSASTGTLFGTSLTRSASIITTSDTGVHPTKLLIGTFTTIPIIFGTGNVERMRIEPDGKIQIGNNIPMWSGSYGGALFLKGNNATGDRYAQLTDVDSTGAATTIGLVVKAGKVGIATTTPGYTLSVVKSVSSDWLAQFNNTYNGNANGVLIDAGNGTLGEILRLRDYAGNNKVSFLSNGNVGIGTTTPGTALSLGDATGPRLYVYEGGLVRAGFGVDMSGSSRELSMFCTSSNGTTGNISFGHRIESTNAYVEKMRLTAGGNLGIGTTTPAASLTVLANFSNNGSYTTSGWAKYIILDAENTGGGGIIWTKQSSTYSRAILNNQGKFEIGRSTANDNSAAWLTDLSIDANGNVGIGTNTPGFSLEVLNASAEIALNASGGSIYRLRSDSTDSFRINKNGVGDRLVIAGNGTATFAGDINTSGSINLTNAGVNTIAANNINGGFLKFLVDQQGIALTLNADATATFGNGGVGDVYLGSYAGTNHFRFHTNNANTFFDMNCGNVNWRQGSSIRYTFFPSTANMTVQGTITQNSDIRIKENVIEIGDCISKVQAMRGVYYNRTDFNTEVTKVGVIAQEVEAVLPELILESPEDGLKSVAYSELTAVLINAIKEQQQIIEDLKTRITKLEN